MAEQHPDHDRDDERVAGIRVDRGTDVVGDRRVPGEQRPALVRKQHRDHAEERAHGPREDAPGCRDHVMNCRRIGWRAMGGASRNDTRITRVRSRVLDLPLPHEFRPAWGRNEIQRSFYLTLVEIEPAAGIIGITAADAGPETVVSIDRSVAPHHLVQEAASPAASIWM